MIRRGLQSGPGPWTPSLVDSPASRPKCGPSQLDLDCKAALQQLLKPAHYQVITPWLVTAGDRAKRDVVILGQCAATGANEPKDPRTAYLVATEPTVVNRNGRVRVASAIPVTADRVQVDLIRVRHGSEQRDLALEARRKFLREFAPVPSTSSVNDYHRLRDVNLLTCESTRPLTEQARRNLQSWQVRGPERDREVAAQAMRGLRCITDALGALPSYEEHSRTQQPGGDACRDSLFEYSKVVPRRVGKMFKAGSVPHLSASRSAPALLALDPKPLIGPQEIQDLKKPGGFVVDLFDKTALQMLKNRERASRSKIANVGGRPDWGTTYTAMARAVEVAG